MGVPSGQHQLRIEIGSFNSMTQVLIQAGMVTDLTSAADKVCLDQNVNIAVIEGAYDHVEGILASLNLTYETKGQDQLDSYMASEAFLSDLNAMNQYDIIFINCGELYNSISFLDFTGQSLQTIYNNLRLYVQGGKSLYLSDWSAPFMEGAFPDIIEFVGADATPSESRIGWAPQTITADVGTPELEALLGRNTATIEFPQDPDNNVVNILWAVGESVGAGATLQLSGDAVLCAIDPLFGCTGAGPTQTGAPLLVTYKDPSGGTVVFTSFHNERQTTLHMDMELILRFLIFQL